MTRVGLAALLACLPSCFTARLWTATPQAECVEFVVEELGLRSRGNRSSSDRSGTAVILRGGLKNPDPDLAEVTVDSRHEIAFVAGQDGHPRRARALERLSELQDAGWSPLKWSLELHRDRTTALDQIEIRGSVEPAPGQPAGSEWRDVSETTPGWIRGTLSALRLLAEPGDRTDAYQQEVAQILDAQPREVRYLVRGFTGHPLEDGEFQHPPKGGTLMLKLSWTGGTDYVCVPFPLSRDGAQIFLSRTSDELSWLLRVQGRASICERSSPYDGLPTPVPLTVKIWRPEDYPIGLAGRVLLTPLALVGDVVVTGPMVAGGMILMCVGAIDMHGWRW